jgi:hypothetical protein
VLLFNRVKHHLTVFPFSISRNASSSSPSLQTLSSLTLDSYLMLGIQYRQIMLLPQFTSPSYPYPILRDPNSALSMSVSLEPSDVKFTKTYVNSLTPPPEIFTPKSPQAQKFVAHRKIQNRGPRFCPVTSHSPLLFSTFLYQKVQ